MRSFYCLRKDDLLELAEVFNKDPDIEVQQSLSCCKSKSGKSYCGYVVEIAGLKTFFTKKLFNYLVEKGILEKQD